MTPLIAGVGGGFLAIIIMIIGIFYFVRKINKKNNLANTPVNSRPTSQQDPAERNSVTLLRSFFCLCIFSHVRILTSAPSHEKSLFDVRSVSPTEGKIKKKRAVEYFTTLLHFFEDRANSVWIT